MVVPLAFAAASTFFSMKSSLAAGRAEAQQAAYRARDFQNQIELSKVRSLENQVAIRERRATAMNQLINSGAYDLFSGTGKALSNRIESVTASDIAANKLNTTFEITSLNISKKSAHQAGRSALRRSRFKAMGSFFNFGSRAVGGFSQPDDKQFSLNSSLNNYGFGKSRGGEFGS